jgi:glutamate---cysteine ligase / carboxylate-amine ligase
VTADDLAATFDAPAAFTVGVEEEIMLLDPRTLELSDCAPALMERLGDDPGFKLELPASQLELTTPPRRDVPSALRDLGSGRAKLLEACEGLARPAAAGVHPFSPVEGRLNSGHRYDRTASEYGPIARSQLVCALQIHVAVGGADRTLAVYNALRRHLPELAALAANSPVYQGRLSGLAAVRPKISALLPRQGIPPHLASWEELACELRWGAAAGAVPDPGSWWWELRPHPRYGTLELRVPDTQTSLADAGAVAAVAHALVVSLAERHDAGDSVYGPPTWRIEENRWSACRHGVEGTLADLDTGERRPTRERLHVLLDQLEPVADRLAAAKEIAHARRLVERNGALVQRDVVVRDGPVGLARWLADRFGD